MVLLGGRLVGGRRVASLFWPHQLGGGESGPWKQTRARQTRQSCSPKASGEKAYVVKVMVLRTFSQLIRRACRNYLQRASCCKLTSSLSELQRSKAGTPSRKVPGTCLLPASVEPCPRSPGRTSAHISSCGMKIQLLPTAGLSCSSGFTVEPAVACWGPTDRRRCRTEIG